MLDRRLRSTKTRLLASTADRLVGVAPQTLTGVGLAVGLGAAGLAAIGWWGPALVAWGANRTLDGLDGEVARRAGRQTDVGGYLDLVADATVYAAIPLGVAAGIGTGGAWVAAAALLATFYVNIVSLTLLSALLEKRGTGAATTGEATATTLPPGLIEGAETVLLFALLLAVPGWAVTTMAVMAVLVAATAVGRIRSAQALLADQPASDPARPLGIEAVGP